MRLPIFQRKGTNSSNRLVCLASKPCDVHFPIGSQIGQPSRTVILHSHETICCRIEKKRRFQSVLKIAQKSICILRTKNRSNFFLYSKFNILSSRVNKRNHDVTLSPCHGQSFVVMCESTWVHERPASASFRDLTVVTQKSASPALKKKNKLSLNEDKRNTAKLV